MQLKHLIALGLAFLLSACAVADPETDPVVDLGDFRLGHNIVVTKNARQIGPSRQATPEEWETLLEGEIARRFEKYQGDKLYHLGINLDGYALALPGIPVVLSPKSALVISLTVWDDAAAAKLNEPPRQITVLEQFDAGSVIGSGLTRKREEQMQNLALNMARAVERYLVANREWFGGVSTDEEKAAAESDVISQEQIEAAEAAAEEAEG